LLEHGYRSDAPPKESKLETPNPTPTEGGASTLDRLERFLSAQDTPEQDQSGQPDASATPETAADPLESNEGAQQDTQSQITTSDLAKYLGVEESALDLDEDGTVKLRTKIDGTEGAAKLADLLKTYQINGHAENKAREVAEREKALQARQQEAEQQFTQRLQYAENLTNVAANQLLQEYQSINWPALEQQDPGQAALLRQKFQDKQAQLRGVFSSLQQQKSEADQKTQAEKHAALVKEAERLPALIPEWKDAQVAAKERQELRDWAIKAGYEPSEIDGISKAHHVAVLRKAMLADRVQAQRPEIENRIRQAPKLVKPGQAANDTQEQKLKNLKHSVSKSGGKTDAVAAYLLATGKV
jgi:hypothetical protein